MKDLGSGKKAYGDLEQMVDNCYDGMMRRIRSEVQLPDEESYRQVCYHLAGFSVKSIAFLMGAMMRLSRYSMDWIFSSVRPWWAISSGASTWT